MAPIKEEVFLSKSSNLKIDFETIHKTVSIAINRSKKRLHQELKHSAHFTGQNTLVTGSCALRPGLLVDKAIKVNTINYKMCITLQIATG